MSYSTPKQWSHGDTVAAAEMQKYSDGLDAIRTMIGEECINHAQPYSQMPDTQTYFLIHKARWLLHVSTGEIQHPTDPVTYPAVSLGDRGGINAFDLDEGVDWLVAGMLYKVVGVSGCMEDVVGIIT